MIRAKLRQARIAAGLRQKDVALAVGISTPYYSQIENGKRRVNIELAASIARSIHAPLDGLFDLAPTDYQEVSSDAR